jgi:hypothetical protein
MQKLTAALSILLFTSLSFAAVSPVAVGIYPPVQFPPDDFNVAGVRASVVGQHRSVYGLDLALIGNTTDLTFVGVGISGIYNHTKGSTYALGTQFAGLGNYNSGKTTVIGLQAALLANVNRAESKVVGLQFSLANIGDHTDIYGVSAGLYNKADEVYGLQIGLINVANNLHGIQIGLINFHNKGLFVMSPIINMGF